MTNKKPYQISLYGDPRLWKAIQATAKQDGVSYSKRLEEVFKGYLLQREKNEKH